MNICKKCKGNHYVFKNENLNTENTRNFVDYKETVFCNECNGKDEYASQATNTFLYKAVNTFFRPI